MISWDNYLKRLTSVSVEYDLARRTIVSFRGNQETLNNFAKERFEDLKKADISYRERFGTDTNPTWIPDESEVQSWLQSYIQTLPQTFEEIENRLNQNELIMKVTLFEIFLKDVHREILKQKPNLLSPNKTIPLGKLIAQGYQKVIEEEIDRAIDSLDRKNIRERAEYFKNNLSVDWTFEGHILPIVEHVFDLRNKILHEEPDRKVGEEDVFHAMTIAMTISLIVIAQCAVLYPDGFERLNNSATMKYFEKKLGKK
jgi:hypothetical protein